MFIQNEKKGTKTWVSLLTKWALIAATENLHNIDVHININININLLYGVQEDNSRSSFLILDLGVQSGTSQ